MTRVLPRIFARLRGRRLRRPVSRTPLGGLLGVAVALGPGCIVDPAYRISRAHAAGHLCGIPISTDAALAAARNARDLYRQPVNLFGRAEAGWAVYAPAVEREVGVLCRSDSPGFADALAVWGRTHGLGRTTGVIQADLLERMKADWQNRRPFVQLRAHNICPAPPVDAALATAPGDMSYGGKVLQLRAGALSAWLRLVRDARRAEPTLAAQPELLTIFSAYRSPAYDDARCATQNNCQGVVRAACSAHRTGLAMDVVLDIAPGQTVDSSADVNRLAMTRGLAYRWLVANAGRYGFVNYVFEPWHWEWTGERI